MFTIIIVSYNSYNEIMNNLGYLNKFRKSIPFTVFIVENGDYIKWEGVSHFDFVYVYYSKSNIGFARANNLAVSACSTDFILFLNPDTIVTEDFITPIISFMKTGASIGVCAPMLIYEDGRYQSSTGFRMGLFYEFLEAFMLIKIFRYVKYLSFKKNVRDIEPVKVSWVSGSCMFVKKSVFESVGGFSEQYFLNYEDIDLCEKLEEKGYSNYYFPFLKCIHLDHRSFDKNYELLVYSRYQSRLIYAERHYGICLKYCIKLIHIFGLALRLVLVNFLYSGLEKQSRTIGYIKSLKLYLGIVKIMEQKT